MHIISISKRPFTVINGKDFAVYRWHEPERHGPVFLQVAGRTGLAREDLPTEDWIVVPGRAGSHRVATAWRKPWFDYRTDAIRKLAFLGASTEGSLYIALRYIARRFGITIEEAAIASRCSSLLGEESLPYYLQRSADRGIATADLITLDLPLSFETESARSLLGTALQPAEMQR